MVFLVAAGHHACVHLRGHPALGPALVRLRELRLKRIIDTDAHHGDGDRDILSGDEDVFHICFCWKSREEEKGKICVNVMDVVGDNEGYLDKVRSTFSMIREFKPEIIVHFFGHDTHWNDYGRLGLTEDVYIQLAKDVKDLAEEVCSGN